MSKKTRDSLARQVIWLLSIFLLLTLPVLAFSRQLGVSPQTLQVLEGQGLLLFSLAFLIIGYYRK